MQTPLYFIEREKKKDVTRIQPFINPKFPIISSNSRTNTVTQETSIDYA
jgi:hypothetical protein